MNNKRFILTNLALPILFILLFYRGTIAPQKPTIDYVNDVKPIVETYCVSCHSGDKPSGGFTLTSYDKVRFEAEKGNLLNRINNKKKPMPKKGLMTWTNRNTIEQWANGGYIYKKKEPIKTMSIEVITDTSILNIEKPIRELEESNFMISSVQAIDIDNELGAELLIHMQGHWVGSLNLMGDKYEWFAFDYRAISSSHVFGIYESGSMGNIFTSFFIADFQGTKTIMARNGGVLNNFYRTSYFVLDNVEAGKNQTYYRLVDAFGGAGIMYIELIFYNDDEITITSYTSHFGMDNEPTKHMQFNGKKNNEAMALNAAQLTNFPSKEIDFSFENGLPKPKWGKEYPYISSASYIRQEENIQSLDSLATLAKDPYPRNEMPALSKLEVNLKINDDIQNVNLIIYLSKNAMTDKNGKIVMEYGYIKEDIFDGILHFPVLAPNTESFTFQYLHAGEYYLTVVADKNEDGYISKGDIVNISQLIKIGLEEKRIIEIDDVINKN